MNKSEDVVYRVCRKSFFSLWSYANPQGKESGKEFCDILVVCAPDVIIFSVKDVTVSGSGSRTVDWRRWQKHAIDDSCKQIYGAERWIKTAEQVIRKDGTPGLPFPPTPARRIHRVAVALGSEDKVPIYIGDFGKGFVHVFDDVSFDRILHELDTVTDFVKYLTDKEEFLVNSQTTKIVLERSEEDLLAYYLSNNRKFPEEISYFIVA